MADLVNIELLNRPLKYLALTATVIDPPAGPITKDSTFKIKVTVANIAPVLTGPGATLRPHPSIVYRAVKVMVKCTAYTLFADNTTTKTFEVPRLSSTLSPLLQSAHSETYTLTAVRTADSPGSDNPEQLVTMTAIATLDVDALVTSSVAGALEGNINPAFG